MYREKFCRGKLKGTVEATFKYFMTIFKEARTADQNWFSAVVFLRGIPVYTELICLTIFPLHNIQSGIAFAYLQYWIAVANVWMPFKRQMMRINI